MATKDNKVTQGEIVSATVRFTNFDDVERKFNISADVNIQDKKVASFQNGSIGRRDSSEYGSGNFSAGADFNYFSFNTNGFKAEEIKEVLAASLEFIGDVNTSVESSNPEA